MLRRTFACFLGLAPHSHIDPQMPSQLMPDETIRGKRLGFFPIHLDPPTVEHQKIFQDLLDGDNGIDHLVLIPNTRSGAPHQHSLHLAAMAEIAAQSIDHVTVDFNALEAEDCRMNRLGKLLAENPGSKVVHWLPDLYEIGMWPWVQEHLRKTHFVLLKPRGFTASMLEHTQCELQGMLPRTHDIVTVDRSPGAENRRRLFEGGSEEIREIVTEPIGQYINSHGLYRDFRKSKTFNWGTHRPTWDPTVSLKGNIPRMMLLYDEKNRMAREIYKKLRCFQVRPGERPDLIVPIGGDGYMMHSIRTHWRKFVPFFGVNAGHVGYLLNNAGTLDEVFSEPLRLYQMPMLYAEATTKNTVEDPLTGEHMREVKTGLAFNDVWIERSSGQTALFNVAINDDTRLKRVRGDGILVSTVAGSTAYALALGASPIPVGTPLIQLVGSNIVSPSRWKPVHLKSEVTVQIDSVDSIKRPCRAFVDSVEIGDVKSLSVRASRVANVQIAFCASCDLQAKLYSLQFPTL